MDHDTVVRQQIPERYLLNELEPKVRDEFEEHYFLCPECARDLHAGALFMEESKIAFASEAGGPIPSATTPSPAKHDRAPNRSGWLDWLRPVFAVPAFALLLAVIGYQGWKYHSLQQAFNRPQTLAAAVVNVSVRGAEPAEPILVSTRPGQPFGLTLNLPPDAPYASYKLDLYSQQGRLEWSRTSPATGNDALWLYVPGSDHVPGALAVHGITAAGGTEDLGRYRIELQNQK
jgi:anti-sigma factor RsiW